MTFKIGDKVLIAADIRRKDPTDMAKSIRAIVHDFKWNLISVQYEDGHREWVDGKRVYKREY